MTMELKLPKGQPLEYLSHLTTPLPCPQELKLLKDQPPEDPVAALQEELAASKVREAEAVLALKELQQTVADLNVMWKRHLEVSGLLETVIGCGWQASFLQYVEECPEDSRR